MDPRIGRFGSSSSSSSINTNANHLQNPLTNPSFSLYNPPLNNNNNNMYHNSHNFRGLHFDPPTTTSSSSPIISSSTEDNELHEDCDLSDAILGYISQVLMEEEMEDKSCLLYHSLDLQAAEKPFYDVIGQKYPPSLSPSPSPSTSYDDEGLFSVDHFIQSPQDTSSLDHHNNDTYSDDSLNGNAYLQYDLNLTTLEHHSASNNNNNNVITLMDSPQICDKDQMMFNFNKGFEEANKFLPAPNTLFPNFNAGVSQVATGSRVRKTTYREDEDQDQDDQRSLKQAAVFQDPTLRSNELDLILLCSMGQGDVALRLLRNTLRTETSKDRDKDKDLVPKSLTKGRGRTRGKKPKSKKQVIDLRTLLVTCAQAVATDDRRNASELLKQIRQHASPFGDGNQRLAHCFANGLEARLAGTGTQIHRGLVSKKVSAADYIRAYYLYIGCSPFRKISNFASNRTIMDMAVNATRIHIIDFGILYGFQWPTFIQRISQREGGPPRLRLTGIEFPQPGFRPAETIEETGARLKEYAKQFNVPFEYNAIAKRWENVNIEDLKIDESEFLVVNCMYRSKNLLDETVGVDSARNVVLDLIRKISPNIFIHGILNGSYNAPFFLTRFKEALFHFSALFDMLETNVPRERPERKLLEGELFGREALNVIACEGWERIERPETYKQWHVRNLRAGFVSVPFSRGIIKLAKEKVGLYHKDFMIDVDNDWLLQGWKGRIIYAISCWKTA